MIAIRNPIEITNAFSLHSLLPFERETHMSSVCQGKFASLVRRFFSDTEASLAPMFAMALVPLVGLVGAAVDYSRANGAKSAMQSALDAAVLTAAAEGGSNWLNRAQASFSSNFAARTRAADVQTPKFSAEQVGDVYRGDVTGSVRTMFLGVVGVHQIPVGVRTAAAVTELDDACILTLGKGKPLSYVSLSLNGAPVINLSNCSIRSNTSLDCNGHDGTTPKAIGAGSVAGCQRPKISPAVPDIYAALASNITPECGTQRPGVTWDAGAIPTGAGVKKVTKATHTEYHICGDLTLSGSGYLTGAAPSADSVIIIENGSLNIANNAAINTMRTGIVMTGNNTSSGAINFPNGNGHAASLNISPPVTAGNPWQAVALYQDPKLTNNVDARWGPGATFSADGLVYLGNTNVVTDGNTSSNNSKCSKFVMNTFTTNGSVKLDFAQSNCAALGLKQWSGRPVRLIQ
jgi:hypothetical protein